MLRALLITIILFTGSVSFAQTCSIIASNIVCKEELMSFDVTASSGIQSVLWDMGDATTSTQQSFSHKYSAKGIKTVKVTIKLTAGGTCITTKQITVYELPKLKILNITGTKNCLSENNICLVDSSSGGDSGIKIKKRIVIWDDGDQTVTTNPRTGDTVCHHYNNPGTYKVTIEITNDKDCKSKTEISITVLQDVVPQISVFSIDNEVLKFCDSARTEFWDITIKDTTLVNSRIYDWGDGTPKIATKSPKLSHFYHKSGFYRVSLTYIQKNGCSTTKDTVIEVVVYSVKFDLIKNASRQCMGSVFRFTQRDVYSGAYYQWFLNDTLQNIFPIDQIDTKFWDFSPDMEKKRVSLKIFNYGCIKR